MLFEYKGIEKENLIQTIKDEQGFTWKQLAESCGCEVNTLLRYARDMTSVVDDRTGRVREIPQKLADVLCTDIETLFPRYFCKLEKELKAVNEELFESQYTLATQDAFSESEFRECFDKMISKIPLREELAVRMYFVDGLTFDEIGNRMDVCRGRSEQIVKRAIYRLKIHIQEMGDYEGTRDYINRKKPWSDSGYTGTYSGSHGPFKRFRRPQDYR